MEYQDSLINRGSIVSCTTCFNQTIVGGVMAFDPTTKMLILKCAADSGQAKLNDVYVVNLELCSEVQIKQEVNTIPNAPPLLNIQRIATRKRNAVDEKRRLVLALTAGVTSEGQKLFMSLSKTMGAEVTWQGSDIVVFGDTFITAPYHPENVSGATDQRTKYVQKLVESQWKDFAATPTAGGATTPSSQAPPAGAATTGAATEADLPQSTSNDNVASNGTTSNTSAAASVAASTTAAAVVATGAASAAASVAATNAANPPPPGGGGQAASTTAAGSANSAPPTKASWKGGPYNANPDFKYKE